MSVPNVGHLDPQRGGCCTVMPYFIGNILELPFTTIQDYSLFNILQERSLDRWMTQTEAIRAKHGLMSFIIHPDYTTEDWSRGVDDALLDHLARLRSDDGTWIALPREVNTWWRARREMHLVNGGEGWTVVGPERRTRAGRLRQAERKRNQLPARVVEHSVCRRAARLDVSVPSIVRHEKLA